MDRPLDLFEGALHMPILKAVSLGPLDGYGVLLRIRQISEDRLEMAMGAHPRQRLKLVVAQGLGLALAGVLIGTATALSLSRFLATLLCQVKPTSYAPYLVGAMLSLAVAALASHIPARRAMRVDAIVAVRISRGPFWATTDHECRRE